MSPDLLNHVGPLLYGEHFKPQLADELGVGLRAVQHWCAGTMAMPPSADKDITRLVSIRRAELDAALTELIGDDETEPAPDFAGECDAR